MTGESSVWHQDFATAGVPFHEPLFKKLGFLKMQELWRPALEAQAGFTRSRDDSMEPLDGSISRPRAPTP